MRSRLIGFATAAAVAFTVAATSSQTQPGATAFRLDTAWPKPLPNNWVLGPASWIVTDARNHVWILHRYRQLPAPAAGAQAAVAAPPLVELDEQGTFVQAWGGPGAGYDWPASEHGLYIDADNNVWVSGGDVKDTHILKFTSQGKFLSQIGRQGLKVGNNDTANVFKGGDMYVDMKTKELIVADGEGGGNRRVIVFDSATGAYKRHWGAYGNPPSDDAPPKFDPAAPPARVFGNSVHCATLASDGLLYICDRGNFRIQVFRPSGEFVREVMIEGGPADVALSPDQRLLYVAGNNKMWVLNRETLQVVGSFGDTGEQPGNFRNLHSVAVDSRGVLYAAEVSPGIRVQRFLPNR
jgi:DNA-binding beta-propeller fold protein YncE